MAKIFTPESDESTIKNALLKSVFLAGTIEMGKSIDWQADVINRLDHLSDVILYNPRRVVAPEDESEIERQINWELDRIYRADVIFMYLAPNSISPISLLELGICLNFRKPLIVVCDPGYTRKQNVYITMKRFQQNTRQHLVSSLDDGLAILEKYINVH